MRLIQGILSAPLVASAALGIQILATDDWLWNASPTHAYGLVAFVAADIFVIAILWRWARLATIGAMVTGGIQLFAMLGDIFAGQPEGIPLIAFKNYLLADNAFLTLLIMQGVILVLSIGTLAIPPIRHHGLSLPRLKHS